MQSAMWRQQIPALTEAGFRTVVFDRRGHGRSGGNGRGYDIDTLADDLAAVMDQLDLEAVTLVGHSMGGCEVVRYLSRHGSSRVTKIVLLASTTPYLIKTPDNALGFPKEALDQMRQVWRADFTQWVSDNAAPFFIPETPQITRDWAIRMLLDCPFSVALATNMAVAEIDFRLDLARIATPTLVLHGDADASALLAITGEPTAKAIKGAKLQVVKGAPHGLFLTHADVVNRAIVGFARA
jgi:pimeloyl-ACP methyl ester carboxylesterase